MVLRSHSNSRIDGLLLLGRIVENLHLKPIELSSAISFSISSIFLFLFLSGFFSG
jgi:hypothetical protein